MAELLERAVAKLKTLSSIEQDAIASMILEELEGCISMSVNLPSSPNPFSQFGRRGAKFKVPLPNWERDLGCRRDLRLPAGWAAKVRYTQLEELVRSRSISSGASPKNKNLLDLAGKIQFTPDFDPKELREVRHVADRQTQFLM